MGARISMTMALRQTPDDEIRATARSLPIALLRARERVMQAVRPMLAEAGVTEAQWRVLRVLDEVGSTDATEIAQEACLLMPSLTRILHGLEDRGLTARRAHPSDGRKALVSITEAGAALIADYASESKRIFSTLEVEFGPEKTERLLDLLNELAGMEAKTAP